MKFTAFLLTIQGLLQDKLGHCPLVYVIENHVTTGALSGVAPSDDREAALQFDLEPGPYTAIVSSEDATTGAGIVEVFGVGSAVGH